MSVLLHPTHTSYAKQLFEHGVAYTPGTDILDVVPPCKNVSSQSGILFVEHQTPHPAISYLKCGDVLVGIRFLDAAGLAAFYANGPSVLYPHSHICGYTTRSEELMYRRALSTYFNRAAAERVQKTAELLITEYKVILLPVPIVEQIDIQVERDRASRLLSLH